MVSYTCVVLYNLFYTVLICIISISWWFFFIICHRWGDLFKGSFKVTELVQRAQRGNCWGKLLQVLCSVLSLRTLLLSCGSQGGDQSLMLTGWQKITGGFQFCHWSGHIYGKKYVYWFSSQLNTFLTLFLYTLHLLSRMSCQIIWFLNVQHQMAMPCSEL